MQDQQIFCVIRILERLLPIKIFHVFELQSWLQVFSVAKYFNFLFGYLLQICVLKIILAIVTSQKIVNFKCQKSPKKVFVNFVQTKSASSFQNTLCNLRKVRWDEFRQKMKSKHVINPLAVDLLSD